MSNDINTLDDLYDDDINKALKELGFIFPKTVEDFQKIENEISKTRSILPDKLKEPLSFLGKMRRPKSHEEIGSVPDVSHYSSNLAQAAREGKAISEDIKKQMKEDKEKSSNHKKKGN